MKKTLLLLFTLTIIASACQKKTSKNIAFTKLPIPQTTFEDSITKTKKLRDSIKQTFLNNKKELHSPVKIVSARLLPNQYSDHKDIRITYKNTTKKNIQAIKLEWYCENSFYEPAHGKFFYIQGKSTGIITKLVKSGTSHSQLWEDFSTDANKIIKARAYYVMFTDGTIWQLNS